MRLDTLATWLVTLATVLGLANTGCNREEPAEPPFEVHLTALDDDDQPLPGVHIRSDSFDLGDTDATGSLTLRLEGKPGTSLPVRITCPEGYRTEGEPPPIVLRRFESVDPAKPVQGMEYVVRCAALEHLAAILVRTKNQPGLAVLLHGKEMATTDESGVAHVVVRGTPGTVFRVSINTASRPHLRPQNPTATFTVAQVDDFFVMDQAFDIYTPPKPKKRKKLAPKRASYPVRIQ
jgi:hypothetical protein